MDTTYLFAVFIPKSSKIGELIVYKHLFPLKVTELQKEVVDACLERRADFLREASRRVTELHSDVVERHVDDYRFGMLDPKGEDMKKLSPYIDKLKTGALERVVIDLTDFSLVRLQ